jgi:putative ABC transport system permease protein
MNVMQILIEAWRSMSVNRLRTTLTMLGIVIGILSVTLLLALGDSMQRYVGTQLQVLGTNMLFISPGGDRAQAQRVRKDMAPALTFADAAALDRLPSLSGAAPVLRGPVKLAVGNETASLEVYGVTPSMFRIRNWKLEQGSVFGDADLRSASRMVIVGQRVADQFFYKQDPLGKYIRIENVAFQVVGVVHGEGRQVDGPDLSKLVIVPITAARAYLVRLPFVENVHYIIAQGRTDGNLDDALDDINETLRDRHHIKLDNPDDYTIDNLASYAETAHNISTGVAIVLGLIGAVSLVVGGIGIMNIMLVSVTERTREIGIRMAIGAKPRDVLLQFLAEAVAVCLTGGAIGVALAMLTALGITASGKFEVLINTRTVLQACGFASSVGVFFGFYPARRASMMQPVDCLRYE